MRGPRAGGALAARGGGGDPRGRGRYIVTSGVIPKGGGE